MLLSLRAAAMDDAEPVAELLTQLGYPVGAEEAGARLQRLRAAGDDVVVAEVDGRVVGVARLHVAPSLERPRPVAQLAALVVDESHRGSGVGRALVDKVEHMARERSCGLLFVTTAARRADAHAFYERVGFERTGHRYAKTLED